VATHVRRDVALAEEANHDNQQNYYPKRCICNRRLHRHKHKFILFASAGQQAPPFQHWHDLTPANHLIRLSNQNRLALARNAMLVAGVTH
jgi:hypothetical protein